MKFRWPWCRTHDGPLIADEDGYLCYWQQTIGGSDPICEVTWVEAEHIDEPAEWFTGRLVYANR